MAKSRIDERLNDIISLIEKTLPDKDTEQLEKINREIDAYFDLPTYMKAYLKETKTGFKEE